MYYTNIWNQRTKCQNLGHRKSVTIVSLAPTGAIYAIIHYYMIHSGLSFEIYTVAPFAHV